jgi:anti-sigma regulatory factor (Ser/Thr protein kinase)
VRRPGAEFVFKIPGHTANLELARDFVKRVAHRCGFNDRDVDDIALAVDEACSNVLAHGAARKPRQIDLRVHNRGDHITIVVINRGASIPAERLQSGGIQDRVEKRLPGGLGLFLIRRLMDEVQLEQRSPRIQALTMVKYHHDQPAHS